jgi:DNA-binding response OmpR family regulator
MRLRFIDDDTELCQLVADYLKPMGFEVEMEHDGERGADRATSEPWTAIILDVMLPGCDGFEVILRIRAKSKVPVMMLTVRGEEVDRIVGLELVIHACRKVGPTEELWHSVPECTGQPAVMR